MPVRRNEALGGFVSSLRHCCFCAAVVTAAAATAEVQAGLTAAQASQRSQEVQQMSTVERARLQRNWQMFQKLPAEQQQHYRQLHRELAEDRGDLKQLLTTYSQWLQTLSPGQREDLRKAKDPKQKLELVRQFKEEQDRQQEGRTLDEDSFTPDQYRRLQRMTRERNPLTAAELRAVMEALANRLPPAEQTRIQKEAKWPRYRQILEASVREAGDPKNWPNSEQQAAILNVLKRSSERRGLDQQANENLRRNSIGRLLLGGLIAEIVEDSKVFWPKESELTQLLQQLGNDERDELMQLPGTLWKDELTKKYFRKRTDQSFLEFKAAEQDFLKFFYRFGHETGLWGGFNIRPSGARSGPGVRDTDRNRDGKTELSPREGILRRRERVLPSPENSDLPR